MARLFTLTVLGILSLAQFYAGPAWATATPAGAAHLKAVFARLISDQQATARMQNRQLRAEGDVVIEPAGSYYAVTLPHLSYVDTDGSYTDVGIIAINAMPGKDDQEWKMTVAIPTPVIRYNAAKKPVRRIDFGKQSFTGLWNEMAGGFNKLDARYENIVVTRMDRGTTLTIPKTSILYDLSSSTDGKTWSGPLQYVMENLSLTRKGDSGKSTLGRVQIDMRLRDYNPANMKAYQERVNTLAGAPSSDLQRSFAFYNLLSDLSGSAWDGLDFDITVNDVKLSRPAIPGSPEGMLSINHFKIAASSGGFMRDNVSLRLRALYDGFDLSPLPAALGEHMPKNANLDIQIENLPFRKLLGIGQKTAEAAGNEEDSRKRAGLYAADAIPKLLTQAGTVLKITKSSVGTQLYHVLIDGHANANMTATMGMDGKMRIDITGMDQIINATRGKLSEEGITTDMKRRLQGTLAALTVLQMTGQQSKDQDGRTVRGYDLELTNGGKILVNGTDLSAIQALVKTTAPAPQTTPQAPAQPSP